MNDPELPNSAAPVPPEPSPVEVSPAAPDEALSAAVREEIDRRFQSAKDKRWAELERQYGALAAHQPPDGEALRARAAALAQQAGLEDLPALTQTEFGLAAYLEVLEAAATAALAQPPRPAATPAQAIQPGGGRPPDDLTAEYQRRLRALRPGDLNGLLALKREFREKGLALF